MVGCCRRTLRAVFDDPDATQSDIADRFGVTAATISQRLNSIEGFEWSNREDFVIQLFDNQEMEDMKQEPRDDSVQTLTDRVDELAVHVQRLESQLEAESAPNQSRIEDPELVVKAMHACLQSEQLSADEEVEILRKLIVDGGVN